MPSKLHLNILHDIFYYKNIFCPTICDKRASLSIQISTPFHLKWDLNFVIEKEFTKFLYYFHLKNASTWLHTDTTKNHNRYLRHFHLKKRIFGQILNDSNGKANARSKGNKRKKEQVNLLAPQARGLDFPQHHVLSVACLSSFSSHA